jgi:hypothetical protein
MSIYCLIYQFAVHPRVFFEGLKLFTVDRLLISILMNYFV